MSYRFVRIIVFFDLPTETLVDRRNYSRLNILVRGNRSSGKSETDSPEHWKPPKVSLLA